MENCEENFMYLFLANIQCRTDYTVLHKIVIPTSVMTVTCHLTVIDVNALIKYFLFLFFFFLQHAFYVQRHLDEV